MGEQPIHRLPITCVSDVGADLARKLGPVPLGDRLHGSVGYGEHDDVVFDRVAKRAGRRGLPLLRLILELGRKPIRPLGIESEEANAVLTGDDSGADTPGHVPCAGDGSVQYGAPFFRP
jgi:hypothetical protein